jgi:hypothetical protein
LLLVSWWRRGMQGIGGRRRGIIGLRLVAAR